MFVAGAIVSVSHDNAEVKVIAEICVDSDTAPTKFDRATKEAARRSGRV